MDPISLTIAALGSSTTKVLAEYIKAYLQRQSGRKLKINIGGTEIEVTGTGELTPEMAESFKQLLASSDKSADNPIALSRKASQEPPSRPPRKSPSDDKVGALALAISPEAVFVDARRRMSVVFRLNLAVAIVLAIILLGGIGGAVFSAVFLRNSTWSFAFGGISAADLLGVYVFKPLSAINASLLGTQRLEMLQLRLSQQLSTCAQHEKLERRIECQTVVWESIQRELAILAGASVTPSTEPTS